MRFSVLKLLAMVTLVGFCISALFGSNELSFQMMAFIVFLLNVIAASASLVGSGQRRIFAVGFLIGCLPYVYLTQPYTGTKRGFLITDSVLQSINARLKLSQERRTPTGETIHLLENGMAHINAGSKTLVKTWQEVEDLNYMKYAYRPGAVPNWRHFMAIGHLVIAIVIGCGNGILTCWLKGRPDLLAQQIKSPDI